MAQEKPLRSLTLRSTSAVCVVPAVGVLVKTKGVASQLDAGTLKAMASDKLNYSLTALAPWRRKQVVETYGNMVC